MFKYIILRYYIFWSSTLELNIISVLFVAWPYGQLNCCHGYHEITFIFTWVITHEDSCLEEGIKSIRTAVEG